MRVHAYLHYYPPLRYVGGELASAEFFFRRLLPRSLGLEACIRGGSAPLFGHDAEQF